MRQKKEWEGSNSQHDDRFDLKRTRSLQLFKKKKNPHHLASHAAKEKEKAKATTGAMRRENAALPNKRNKMKKKRKE